MKIVLKLISVTGATDKEKQKLAKAIQKDLRITAEDYMFEGLPYDDILPDSLMDKFGDAEEIEVKVKY